MEEKEVISIQWSVMGMENSIHSTGRMVYAVPMSVRVSFYSYCQELAGCAETVETVSAGESLGGLVQRVFVRFPKLAGMNRSLLMAVGVEYQTGDYVLKDGDEVALFPPVQGG